MDIRCPNCGRQIDRRAGYVNEGRVFICEKGKPITRKTKYRCPSCDSTIIILKRYDENWTES